MKKEKFPDEIIPFFSSIAQLIEFGIKNNIKPTVLVDYVEEVIIEAIKRIEKYENMQDGKYR